MVKYLVILNPTADRGQAAKREPEIHDLFRKYQLDYQLVLTQYIGHAIELTAQALSDGIPYIIAGGGDGTANEIINGMMLEKISTGKTAVLGVLPVGRGDDFAFSMGVPTESLEESVAAIAAGVTRKIDIGLATSDLYPNGRYFGNGVGTGFDAVVGFVAARNRVLRGFASYLWAALKTILLYYRAPQVKIELDNEILDLPAIMISTMNGIRLGGTFFIAPKSHAGDGLLNLCVVRQISRPRMLQLLLSFMKGAQYADPAVMAKMSRKVVITTEKGALPTHMDGETLSIDGKQITIELFPQQIEIIVKPVGVKP